MLQTSAADGDVEVQGCGAGAAAPLAGQPCHRRQWLEGCQQPAPPPPTRAAFHRTAVTGAHCLPADFHSRCCNGSALELQPRTSAFPDRLTSPQIGASGRCSEGASQVS